VSGKAERTGGEMKTLEVMMEASEIPVRQGEIDLYELLCTTSKKMLKAAKDEAWDDILAFEQQHNEIYTCLRKMDGSQELEAFALDRKADLINQILRMDRQTQGLITERMDKLQKGGAEERKIMQAYGVCRT